METQAPAEAGAKPNRRKTWIIVAAVVALIVIVGGGILIYKNRNKSSSSAAFVPAPKISKELYTAWQTNNRTAAAKLASGAAVTQIFALNASQNTGLTFGACKKVGSTGFPKTCTFTRPGGTLVMTLTRAPKNDPIVTTVVLQPAATTPSSTPPST